jgi:hypothetical protein
MHYKDQNSGHNQFHFLFMKVIASYHASAITVLTTIISSKLSKVNLSRNERNISVNNIEVQNR